MTQRKLNSVIQQVNYNSYVYHEVYKKTNHNLFFGCRKRLMNPPIRDMINEIYTHVNKP